MTTKISCGGFDIDNNTLIEEDGVLKVKGGGGGVLVVHGVGGEQGHPSLDKTWREIRDAVDNMPILLVVDSSTSGVEYLVLGHIVAVFSDVISSRYYVTAEMPSPEANPIEWGKVGFVATSEDGYPVYQE